MTADNNDNDFEDPDDDDWQTEIALFESLDLDDHEPPTCEPPYHPDPGDENVRFNRSKRLYLVRNGRILGVFTNWQTARAQVNQYRHADHQSFDNWEDCVENWRQHCATGTLGWHTCGLEAEEPSLHPPPPSTPQRPTARRPIPPTQQRPIPPTQQRPTPPATRSTTSTSQTTQSGPTPGTPQQPSSTSGLKSRQFGTPQRMQRPPSVRFDAPTMAPATTAPATTAPATTAPVQTAPVHPPATPATVQASSAGAGPSMPYAHASTSTPSRYRYFAVFVNGSPSAEIFTNLREAENYASSIREAGGTVRMRAAVALEDLL